MQSHVNDPGAAEGGSAHRAGGNSGGGPSVSPSNLPPHSGNQFQHRGSRSVDEYRRLEQIGEGQYGQVILGAPAPVCCDFSAARPPPFPLPVRAQNFFCFLVDPWGFYVSRYDAHHR